MDSVIKRLRSEQRGAALIIVLAFVVLFAGLAVAYLSRTTTDRQVANSSYNQSNVDQLVQSAVDNIIGDLRQEIANGSTAIVEDDGTTVYLPTTAANMVPRRSGNSAVAPNLVRCSIRSDPIQQPPGRPSRASAVNSTTDASANGRSVTLARWNWAWERRFLPAESFAPSI
jgi:Tfp pilus assembly protein PilX